MVPVVDGMISEVASSLLGVKKLKKSVPDSAGERTEVEVDTPIWLKPQASKATPMFEAFERAYGIVQQWIVKWPTGFPPFLINITGRECAYPELTQTAAKQLMELNTTDGNVLVFNVYISDCVDAIIFPNKTVQLIGDKTAELLFTISSRLPKTLFQYAADYDIFPQSDARCLVVNTDSVHPITGLLSFETRGITSPTIVSLTQTMRLKLLTRTFITHKLAETMDDCQDALEVNEDEDVGLYAVADGATLSFMSKSWAAFLVKHFCKTTDLSLTEDNWKEWLHPIQQAWYQEVEKQVKTLNRYWLTNQFLAQKSATSTFIGLNIAKDTGKWRAMIIGDNCLFHQNDSGVKSYLIENSADFTNRPEAFTSFEKDNYYPPTLVSGEIKPGDTLILATDALAKWILMHRETGTLETALNTLKTIETEIQFNAFLNAARTDETIPLRNDDVTLVLISADTDEVSSL